MSLHRRAAKRDTSEKDIVDTFLRCGWSVEPHSGDGAPDLLVGKFDIQLWIECKSGKRGLNARQKAWHAAWKGPKPYVMRSAEDVLALNKVANSLQTLAKK